MSAIDQTRCEKFATQAPVRNARLGMTENVENVHVAFGWAIAESICDALRMLGRNERVIGLPENLSFGPINPPDTKFRHAWMRSILRCEPSDGLREIEQSWTIVTSPDVYPVFWVCKSCAAEQATFLEFVFRMDGRPFDIIDATGLDFVTADCVKRPWSLGLMRPEDIVSCGLYRKRRLVSSTEMSAALRVWSQLRKENAPFRIVRDGTLVSASLTYFDAFLIDRATQEWEIAARLIGRTVTSMSFDMEPPGQSPGAVVLFGCMLALGESGLLETVGSGPDMRDYKVRKPYVHRLA